MNQGYFGNLQSEWHFSNL